MVSYIENLQKIHIYYRNINDVIYIRQLYRWSRSSGGKLSNGGESGAGSGLSDLAGFIVLGVLGGFLLIIAAVVLYKKYFNKTEIYIPPSADEIADAASYRARST